MTAEVEKTIYDFEGIADALAGVLNSIDIRTLTSNAQAKFQKRRPRVEVVFSPGDSIGNLLAVAGVDNTPGALREITFNADITASVITPAFYEAHSSYRAKVRSVVAVLKDSINGNVLQYHKINSIRTVGSQFYASTEEKLFRTDLHYKAQFSIQYNAFGLFAPPVVNNGQVAAVAEPNGAVYAREYPDPNAVGFKPNNVNAAAIYYEDTNADSATMWRWNRSLGIWILFL